MTDDNTNTQSTYRNGAKDWIDERAVTADKMNDLWMGNRDLIKKLFTNEKRLNDLP